MPTPRFSNSDLHTKLYNTLRLQVENIVPEDITVEVDETLQHTHVLNVDGYEFYYAEEHNRDHDRDLLMAIILISMQDDGMDVKTNLDGKETRVKLTDIKECEVDGSIYTIVEVNKMVSISLPITSLTIPDIYIPSAIASLKND